jgi:hypothetical protein
MRMMNKSFFLFFKMIQETFDKKPTISYLKN